MMEDERSYIEENVQEQLMTWAGRASEDDRMQFLKRFLDALPETELTQVSNLVSKAKKRRKRFTARPVSVPVVSVSAPEDSSPDLEESTTALCVSATEVHMEETVSAPDSSVSVPVNSKDLRWCDKYQDNQVVAMDIEKVEHRIKKQPGDNSKKQFVMKAAIVSVVNNLGEEIYRATIKHKPDDIRINQHAFKINGIRKSDLVAGKNLKDVQTELQAILQGKLVIMHGAEQDFNSLELPMGDFDYFDTQLFWFNCYITSNGKTKLDNYSLRSLCYHFFGIDCQHPGEIHDPSNDAKWTVKLFIDAYKKDPSNKTRINPFPSNHIAHVKRDEPLPV